MWSGGELQVCGKKQRKLPRTSRRVKESTKKKHEQLQGGRQRNAFSSQGADSPAMSGEMTLVLAGSPKVHGVVAALTLGQSSASARDES